MILGLHGIHGAWVLGVVRQGSPTRKRVIEGCTLPLPRLRVGLPQDHGVSFIFPASFVLDRIEALGTDRLQVQAGQSFFGEASTLPEDAAAMVRRIGPVTSAVALTAVDATVRRTDLIPAGETGGISVQATEPSLLASIGGTVREGRFLDGDLGDLPAVVLGATAAERLGIRSLVGSPMVWLGGQWFAVVGILVALLLPGSGGRGFRALLGIGRGIRRGFARAVRHQDLHRRAASAPPRARSSTGAPLPVTFWGRHFFAPSRSIRGRMSIG